MGEKIKKYDKMELTKMFRLSRQGSSTAHPLMEKWTQVKARRTIFIKNRKQF
jgi:hypothetical protein